MVHKRSQAALERRSRPCLDCGVLVLNPEPNDGARCWKCRDSRRYDHRPQRGERQNDPGASARGYDSRWQRLSKQARREQPFCAECGCPEDLTTDHLVWPARTLKDVQVLCRPCNSSRGPHPDRVA